MSKKAKVLKILKWVAIAAVACFILPILWFGTQYQNPDEGKIKFFWSGFEALFSDAEFGLGFNREMHAELDGVDGPYIIGDTLYRINEKNELAKEVIANKDSIAVFNTDNSDNFVFSLKQSHTLQPNEYAMPERLIAISDIEGNLKAFSSFLQNNGVIDKDFNWTFGKGHAVFLGDFVDRGKEVTQVLWLIYKLEQQAVKAGGKVHYILGNHEAMNIQGSLKYVDDKYVTAAQLISGIQQWDTAYRYMMSEKTELGSWLRSKNAIEKIGDYIFVHAGISPEILPLNISLDDINTTVRQNIDSRLYHEPGDDLTANFVIGRNGPLWYRGIVEDYKYYDKITAPDLDKVLTKYEAKKMVIGHTIVDQVSTDFNGKVIRIDVAHGKEKNSPQTQGLLIENGEEYKINAIGQKEKL